MQLSALISCLLRFLPNHSPEPEPGPADNDTDDYAHPSFQRKSRPKNRLTGLFDS